MFLKGKNQRLSILYLSFVPIKGTCIIVSFLKENVTAHDKQHDFLMIPHSNLFLVDIFQ